MNSNNHLQTNPFINFWNWLVSLVSSKTGKTATVTLGTRSWKDYAPAFDSQKYAGDDTDDCWDFSGLKCIAYSMNFLLKNNNFSQEAQNFFKDNGYLDASGSFAFSDRYIAILSGKLNNGNSQIQSGVLAATYGLIPRTMLNFTPAQATADGTYPNFVNDYYNPQAITTAMEALGQKFLTYVSIVPRYVGTIGTTPDIATLNAALQVAPLQIGIPIPSPAVIWNNPTVAPFAGMAGAQHAVALLAVNGDGSYNIDDQYSPEFKILGAGYLIDICTQYVVSPVISQALVGALEPVIIS